MDWLDPTAEEQIIVVVAALTIRHAETLSESCEGCNTDYAEIPFDWILDRVIGSDSSLDRPLLTLIATPDLV